MLEFILSGGLIMWPLVFCSMLALAVIIDRIRAFRLANEDTVRLRMRVSDLLMEGNIDSAIRACEKASGPVAAVLLAGLSKYRKMIRLGRPASEIEITVAKTMEDYAPRALDALETRVSWLSMVGSLSPLLGMTGTVTGMIASFDALRESAGLDAGAVSAGISEALITTAAGLLIAMPAVVAYQLFSRRIDVFILEIDRTVVELVDFISLGRRGS